MEEIQSQRYRVLVDIVGIAEEMQDIDQLEEMLFDDLMATGRKIMERILQHKASQQKRKCVCGNEVVEFKGAEERRLETSFGGLCFKRERVYCPSCKRSVYPLDETIGLSDRKNVTKKVSELAILGGISWPYVKACEVVHTYTKASIGPRTIESLLERQKDHVKRFETKRIQQVATSQKERGNRKLPRSHRLYIVLNSTYINSRERGAYAEGKVGVIFREEDITTIHGRANLKNERYVCGFDGNGQLGQRLYGEAFLMGSRKAAEIILVGDGSPWIREIQRHYFPQATSILNWQRVREHVDIAISCLPGSRVRKRQWFDSIEASLWEGNYEAARNTIRAIQSNLSEEDQGPLTLLSNYLERNREDLPNYKQLHQAGYYIGSGSIQTVLDLVIARRQRKRGMWWSKKGADNLANLRTIFLNGEWSTYWNGRRLSSQVQ